MKIQWIVFGIFIMTLTGCYDKSISKNCGQGYKMSGCGEPVETYDNRTGIGPGSGSIK